MKLSVFFFFLAFRLFNAAITRTFWQPDEYWQSLEPAHFMTYGYGYLTWEWQAGLRSVLHPMIFTLAYKLANLELWKSLGLTSEFYSQTAIVWVPYLVQVVFAALADYHFVKFAKIMFKSSSYPYTTGSPNNNPTKFDDISFYAMVITAGSAFNFFASTRTFANSLEMSLTSIALSYWPWRHKNIKWSWFLISLSIASISCMCRPTNALIWIFLGTILLAKTNSKLKVAIASFSVFSSFFAANCLLDYYWYSNNQPTIDLFADTSKPSPDTILGTIFNKVFTGDYTNLPPIFKFLKFNLIDSISDFYGVSPQHYYLTQGLPLLLIGYLPFTVLDILRSKSSHSTLLITFVIAVYSFINHKEVRFIYPLIPILHIKTLNAFLRHDFFFTKKVLAGVVVLNLAVAGYFNTFHQRGVMDVMAYFRNTLIEQENEASVTDTKLSSIGFLMPCHSTPWQSHLHSQKLNSWSDLWFLTCEPPIGVHDREQRKLYRDVSDQFYDDPAKFIESRFPPLSYISSSNEEIIETEENDDENVVVKRGTEAFDFDSYEYSWPSHLVFFEALKPTIDPILNGTEYKECKRFFNSHFHEDARRRGDVIVYCK